MMKHLRKLALSIALAAGALPALAGNTGWYAGVGIGQSSVSDWLSEDDMLSLLDDFGTEMGVNSFAGTISSDADDEDAAWKIYGGYNINPNFAIEASYMDLGEATASAAAVGTFNTGGGPFPGSLYVRAKGEAQALTIDAVGKVAVAPWLELFVKGGLFNAELDITGVAGATDSSGVLEASDSGSDNSSGLHIGLGADFSVTPDIVIRAEWERLADVEFDGGETDIDLLSVSAAYRF
jgi:OOP family OmpA-OmpF porin